MKTAMNVGPRIFYGLIGSAYLTITGWGIKPLFDIESMTLPLPMWYVFLLELCLIIFC